MKSEIIFSGIGGQGIILLGKIICKAAAGKGLYVTLAPAYGQEKRGGRTSCQVVISEQIGSPVISEADTILVMDEDSLKDYEGRLKPDGCLIINSSMITSEVHRNDIKIVKIAVNDIAGRIGSPKSANMVALGAVARTLDIITLEDLKAELKASMKEEIADINIRALETGYCFNGSQNRLRHRV